MVDHHYRNDLSDSPNIRDIRVPYVYDESDQLMFKKWFKEGEDPAIRDRLGLDYYKRAMEAHSNTISVEHEVGKGTTFPVILPMKKQVKKMTYLEDKFNRHIVKSFLDILVLTMLYENPLHGYKILADLHTRFGVLLSPGTVYPLLYRLEEEKLVEAEEVNRTKVYRLTPQGRSRVQWVVKLLKKNTEKMLRFLEGQLS